MDYQIKLEDCVKGIKEIKNISKEIIKGLGKGIYHSYAAPTAARREDERYTDNGSIECYIMGGCLAGAIPDLLINMGIVSIINSISNQSIDPPFLTLMAPHIITNTISGTYEHLKRISCDRKIKSGNKGLENLSIIEIDTSGL